MTRSEIAIATITRARDSDEERLLLASLAALDGQGIPMFIADGGSIPSFVEALGALAHATVVEPSTPGLVAQVRAAVTAAAATRAPIILYTEPDKQTFFERHLVDVVDRAPRDAGVVIASRSPDAFATFPSMQRTTESAINAVCGELFGADTDYCYGPFLFDARMARSLDDIADDLGWGWRFALFSVAHAAGARLAAVVGPYECPPDQREESPDDRRYRITQLEQNVRGVLAGGVLHPDR